MQVNKSAQQTRVNFRRVVLIGVTLNVLAAVTLMLWAQLGSEPSEAKLADEIVVSAAPTTMLYQEPFGAP